MDKTQKLATLLHNLLCKKGANCLWIYETQEENTWTWNEHYYWLNTAGIFLEIISSE